MSNNILDVIMLLVGNKHTKSLSNVSISCLEVNL